MAESAGRRITEHSREGLGIEALQRRGFTASFVVEGDRLRVSGSEQSFPPESLRIVDHYRFEGTSDPDDASVIYALEADDGTRGVLVDAYGAYADPAVGAVLDRMRVDRRPRRMQTFGPIALWLVIGAAAIAVVAAAVVVSRRTL